jgi:NADP-dependent 3-hydroxy acid dehydrogenase YdfG
METLKGKIVLIVGASGGIGAKTAKLVSGSGAIVFIAGRNKERLQALAAECQIPATQFFEMEQPLTIPLSKYCC